MAIRFVEPFILQLGGREGESGIHISPHLGPMEGGEGGEREGIHPPGVGGDRGGEPTWSNRKSSFVIGVNGFAEVRQGCRRVNGCS